MSENLINPEDIDNSPSEIAGDGVVDAKHDRDYKDRFLEVSEELVYQKEQNGKLRVRMRELESTAKTNELLDSLIVPMATKIFVFLCLYCLGVWTLLVVELNKHQVSDNVLKILVGSTAVAVVGLVGTIVAGIYAGARRHSG